MSGALPNVEFTAINISSNQKTLVSTTDSGKTYRRQIDGQRWKFTCQYKLKTRADFQSIMAFIIKQRGQKESFTITFPSYLNATGVEAGTVLVNGVHAVADTTIALDGFGADGSGRFKAGDFIKFNSHSKVYMIVADVTSSSNAATVTIEPPLTTALANNGTTVYDSIPFTVHLTSDLQEFPSSNIDKDGNLLYNFEFDVIEAI
jgi:hypothetical protein